MNSWKKIFAIIWSGQLFSILSSAIVQFAIVLWISLETGSAEVLAIASIAALLPQAVLGPFIGVFVDRLNRKWTMIAADGFVALCSGALAILYHLDIVEMWHIYLILMLRSIGNTFHSPAMQSSVPLLAPESELTRIAGVNQALQAVSGIGGPILGTLLITNMSMTAVMMVDILGAAIACCTLLFVNIPNPEPSKEVSSKNVMREMSEGFNAIWHKRGLAIVMLIEVLGMFVFMPIIVILPLMTLNNFNGDAYDVSIVEMSYGIGALVGGVIMGVVRLKTRKVVIISLTYILSGIILAICGVLPQSAFIVYVILTLIMGCSIPFYAGSLNALIQTQIEPALLGRAFSFFMSISTLPSIFGLMATGYLADALGIANIFLIGGILVAIIGSSLLFIPSVMKLEKRGT